MKKFVFTIGYFDRINSEHAYLLRETVKSAVPNGEAGVVVFNDLSIFKHTRSFPYQTLEIRRNNLAFFLKPTNIINCFEEDPSSVIETIVKAKQEQGIKCSCVMLNTQKKFVGREKLKELGVPIKFIKPLKK